MKKQKPIPKFKSQADEDTFWQKHDSADFIDWSDAKQAQFPELKPSTKTISLRIPDALLNELKILAHKEDTPYQSLIKILLAQGVISFRKKCP